METKKLPKTIVIPGRMLRFCILQLIDELWGEDAEDAFHADLKEWLADRGAGLSLLQKREATASMHAALAEPWWRRREFADKEWSENAWTVIAGRLETMVQAADRTAYVRVPVRFADFLGRADALTSATPTTEELEEGQMLTMSMVQTPSYCEWVSAGGDPDFGRWCAMFWLVV